MNAHLLARAPHAPRPALELWPDVALPLTRAHELCGPARQFLALLVAGACTGPVFWIGPAWSAQALNPEAMVGLAAPERFHFVSANREEDLLWALEEVLRSGVVPLAVADLPAPPGMTAVRRLHLAAETGAASSGQAPLGLLLTPGQGGAPGIETRWHITQHHSAPSSASGAGWQLTRSRARTQPPRCWSLTGRPGAWALADAPVA
jgi:protein ImuA